MIDLVEGPIDVQSLVEATATDADGGVCIFLGRTRNHSAGRCVVGLSYDAYRAMARQELRALASHAARQFGVERIGLLHRLGPVAIGEVSVAIVAAAPHRDAAFAACRFLIDELKKSVPIWKHERFEDGDAWVGDPDHPASRS